MFTIELGRDGVTQGGTDKAGTITGSLTSGQKKTSGPFKAAIGTVVSSTSGTGDTDLYVRKTSVSTTTSYTGKSDGSTSVGS